MTHAFPPRDVRHADLLIGRIRRHFDGSVTITVAASAKIIVNIRRLHKVLYTCMTISSRLFCTSEVGIHSVKFQFAVLISSFYQHQHVAVFLVSVLQVCVSWCPSSYVVMSTLLASMNAV